MLKPQNVVLVDTNVLIEAHRTGCLAAIAGAFSLHTVEAVIVETQTGFHLRRKTQTIDEKWLRDHMRHIAAVSDEQLFVFDEQHGEVGLHDGEKALVIYAETLMGKDVWYLNSPDKATVRYAISRGWSDRLISLEAMCERVGVRPKESFAGNFTERWLGQAKTDLTLALLKKS